MSTLTRIADRLLDHPWLQECSEDMRKDIVAMVLREVRVPSEGMEAAGVMALIDAGLDGPDGVGHSDTIAARQAMIDHILKDNDHD